MTAELERAPPGGACLEPMEHPLELRATYDRQTSWGDLARHLLGPPVPARHPAGLVVARV